MPSQLITIADLTESLRLSDIEIRRAYCLRRLTPAILNPESEKCPELAFTQTEFERFAMAGLEGLKLPKGFFDARGWLSGDQKAGLRMKAALKRVANDIPRTTWLTAARRLNPRLRMTKHLVVPVETTAINDVIIQRHEARWVAQDIAGTIGGVFIVDRARRAMRLEIADRFGIAPKPSRLHRLYWSPTQFNELVTQVVNLVLDDEFVSTPVFKTGRTGDGEEFSFYCSVSIRISDIFGRQRGAELIRSAF